MNAFREGGWGMWPILALLLAGLAVIVERAFVLGRARAAIRLPIAAAARREELAAVMLEARAGLQRRLGQLPVLANLATLSGLLGTIVGLLRGFRAAAGGGTLAATLSECLNCTAFGLLTGVLLLAAGAVLGGWQRQLVLELERCAQQARRRLRGPSACRRQPIVAPRATASPPRRTPLFASLQLTPLIDVFLVLVLFLLVTFQSSGETCGCGRRIALPLASRVEELERAPVIAVSFDLDHPGGGVVTLDGSEVATVWELVEDDSGPDWKIATLTEQLEVKKNNFQLTHPAEPFPGAIIIQADRNVDVAVLKKIVYSAGLADYHEAHLAVKVAAGAGR